MTTLIVSPKPMSTKNDDSSTGPGDHDQAVRHRAGSLSRIARSQTQAELDDLALASVALATAEKQKTASTAGAAGINCGSTSADCDVAHDQARALPDDATNLDFKGWQFVKTFLYESLPHFVNLLAILPIEYFLEKRSLEEIQNFVRHRLYVLTLHQPAFPFPLQLLTLALPNVLIWAALYLWISDDERRTPGTGVRAVLDLAEILAWAATIVMRNCVVAVKYGYIEQSEIDDQYKSSAHYHAPSRMQKQIFMGGWAAPNDVDPSILQSELAVAMRLCDCDLKSAEVRMKPVAVEKELQKRWRMNTVNLAAGVEKSSSSTYRVNVDHAGAGELQQTLHDHDSTALDKNTSSHPSAFDLLQMIVSRTIASPLPGKRRAFMLLGPVAVFIPPIVRAVAPGNLASFGSTATAKFAVACCVWSPAMYVALMAGYSQVAIWTYMRRAKAFELLDRLCGEGVAVKELLLDHVDAFVETNANASGAVRKAGTTTRDAVEASFLEQRVVLDLADSGTIVSLLLLRRCIRKIGTRYNLRMDGFSMAFFAVGVLFVGTLCLFYLTPARVVESDAAAGPSTSPRRPGVTAIDHRLATDVLLCVFSFYVCVTLATLVVIAARCNATPRFRTALQRAALTACAGLVDEAAVLRPPGATALATPATTASGDSATWNRLIAHKELLQMADLQVGYEEEVVDPVTVLGRPASMLTVGATLSAIFTGFVIAVQGWIGHRGEGWDYSDVDGVWRPPTKVRRRVLVMLFVDELTQQFGRLGPKPCIPREAQRPGPAHLTAYHFLKIRVKNIILISIAAAQTTFLTSSHPMSVDHMHKLFANIKMRRLFFCVIALHELRRFGVFSSGPSTMPFLSPADRRAARETAQGPHHEQNAYHVGVNESDPPQHDAHVTTAQNHHRLQMFNLRRRFIRGMTMAICTGNVFFAAAMTVKIKNTIVQEHSTEVMRAKETSSKNSTTLQMVSPREYASEKKGEYPYRGRFSPYAYHGEEIAGPAWAPLGTTDLQLPGPAATASSSSAAGLRSPFPIMLDPRRRWVSEEFGAERDTHEHDAGNMLFSTPRDLRQDDSEAARRSDGWKTDALTYLRRAGRRRSEDRADGSPSPDHAKRQPNTPAEHHVEADTTYGTIRGNVRSFEGTTVHEYLGVPYAAPPVGDRRFKSPVEPESWAPSVFDATKRGKFCPQQPVSYVPKEEQSEDCLTLSIWVPDVPGRDHPTVSAPGAPPLRRHKKKLPMLLWIHGGSFHSDWPRPYPLFDGARLATIGEVIVVSLNYRLGAVGALSFSSSTSSEAAPNEARRGGRELRDLHGEDGGRGRSPGAVLTSSTSSSSTSTRRISSLVPGNQALLDQQLAVEFLRKNADAFHGDGERITVFGQSSGGVQAAFHLVSQLNEALFGSFPMANVALYHQKNPIENALQLAEQVGCGGVAGKSKGYKSKHKNSTSGRSRNFLAPAPRSGAEKHATPAENRSSSPFTTTSSPLLEQNEPDGTFQSVESDLLRCLQKVDIEKIVKEQDWVGTWTTWTPVIDDYMFKAPPASEDDHERQYFDISPMRNVQLLVGCNSGEAMPNMEIQTQHDFDAAVQRKLAQTGWCRERHNEKPSCQLSEAELQLVRKQYLKTEYFENRKFYASDNKPFSPWAVAAQAVFNDIDPVRRMRSLAALHYHVNKEGVAATKENLAMSEQKMKLWFEDEFAAGETTYGDGEVTANGPGARSGGNATTEPTATRRAAERGTASGTQQQARGWSPRSGRGHEQLRRAGTKSGRDETSSTSATPAVRSFQPSSTTIQYHDNVDREQEAPSTFAYTFTHGSSFEPTSFGDNNGSGPDWYHWLAPHGAELDFLWGTALARGTREEQALSRAFMRYVANFAYTGDVNKGPHSHQLILDHDDVLDKDKVRTGNLVGVEPPLDVSAASSNSKSKKRRSESSTNDVRQGVDEGWPVWPPFADAGGAMIVDDVDITPHKKNTPSKFDLEKQGQELLAEMSKWDNENKKWKLAVDIDGPRGEEFKFWRALLHLPDDDGAWPADFLNPPSGWDD